MLEELEIFLEDCDDQLQMMEDALIQMQNSGVDEELIGAIFRAVHTIKGSAGMFGFEDIVAFTHTGENLFDRVRQGDIAVTADMIDLFLLCKDHAQKLIDVEINETKLDENEKKVGEALTQRLNDYIDAKETTEEKSLETIESSSDAWHISIRLKKDFFTTGMSIHSILNFLKSMGTITINQPILYTIPLLNDYNPLTPYIGFELLLEATTTKEDIEDVFEFILDDVDLYISKQKDTNHLQDFLQLRNEDKLQETLISCGIYSNEDFSTDDKSAVIHVDKTSEIQIIEKESVVKNKPSSSLRVDSNKIDLLINYMSEIVTANSKILSLVEKEQENELNDAAQHMKELLEYVRDAIMDIRMVQVGDSFNKFRRIVGDTSKKIGKEIDFVISGEETELDKTVVEKISDPLVHMLRNSIDHGIEFPQERIDKGKKPCGRVDLRAYADSGTIVIEIQDDGKGLDKDRILQKAINNGLIKESATLSDAEIYKLIFEAGLSTADKVSDISGRGVGMDVVRRNIEDLRGSIDIDSAIDKGSTITIRLPLTLAIINGFLVQVGTTKYIIPLDNIQECIELTAKEKENMKGNEFINLRGEMLPLMDIRSVLHEEKSLINRQNIVIVRFGKKIIGLLVDELLGEYQTVIKSLGDVFDNVPGISGGSILGSGEIALIFDIARLIEYKQKVANHE